MDKQNLPNYANTFNLLIVNKVTGKYLVEGAFLQALENRDIILMYDGSGLFVLLSESFSKIYTTTDLEDK